MLNNIKKKTDSISLELKKRCPWKKGDEKKIKKNIKNTKRLSTERWKYLKKKKKIT